MGKFLRNLGLLLIFAPLFAMFSEPFFAAVFDYLKWDTEKWAVPTVKVLVEIFASDWFRLIAMLAIGFGAGVYAHWIAIKFDEKKFPSNGEANKAFVDEIYLSKADDNTSRYWAHFTINKDVERLVLRMDYRFWIGRKDGKWSEVTRHKVVDFKKLIRGQTKAVQIVAHGPGIMGGEQPYWAVGETDPSGFILVPPNYAKVQITFLADGNEQHFRLLALPREPKDKLILITQKQFSDNFFADEPPLFQESLTT